MPRPQAVTLDSLCAAAANTFIHSITVVQHRTRTLSTRSSMPTGAVAVGSRFRYRHTPYASACHKITNSEYSHPRLFLCHEHSSAMNIQDSFMNLADCSCNYVVYFRTAICMAVATHTPNHHLLQILCTSGRHPPQQKCTCGVPLPAHVGSDLCLMHVLQRQ